VELAGEAWTEARRGCPTFPQQHLEGTVHPFLMMHLLSLLALPALALSAVVQQLLVDDVESQTPLISTSKELVNSTALEAHITKTNLLERAKHLFKIAELGAEEYNHPTRVIGSKGKPQLHHCIIYETPC